MSTPSTRSRGPWAAFVALALLAASCGVDGATTATPAVEQASSPAATDPDAADDGTVDSDTDIDDDDAGDTDTGDADADAAGPPGGGDGLDACDLLSEDEVTAALGEPVVAHGPAAGVGESVCTWETEAYLTVTVSVGSPGTAAGDDFEVQHLMGGEPEPAAGLDGSGWYVGMGTVDFAADERHNAVQVVRSSGPDQEAAAELALLVRDRIESAG